MDLDGTAFAYPSKPPGIAMKTLKIRLALALILATTAAVFGVLSQSRAQPELAELTKPIEAAAQTVIDGTEAVRDFGSFLPGNFK